MERFFYLVIKSETELSGLCQSSSRGGGHRKIPNQQLLPKDRESDTIVCHPTFFFHALDLACFVVQMSDSLVPRKTT